MKSNKQRRAEIREKRLRAAETRLKEERNSHHSHNPGKVVSWKKIVPRDIKKVRADPMQWVSCRKKMNMNNLQAQLGLYYYDQVFHCAQCAKEQVWTAKAQKEWFEIAKGDIESEAKYCRPCRIQRHQQKREAKKIHFRGVVKKHGLEKAADILRLDEEEVRRILEEDISVLEKYEPKN